MNSSRNIISQQKKEEELSKKVKVPAKSTKKPSRFSGNMKPIILTVLCVVVVVVLCVGVAMAQLKPKVAVVVDKTKITMNDMLFPIYEVESQYAQINSLYEQQLGSSFWEQTYQGSGDGAITSATGMNNASGFKQQIMDSEVSYVILSGLAKDAGQSLTDEEKEDAHKDADKAVKGLSWLQKLRLDITKSGLYKRFETRALANKFKDAKQEELNKEVDEKAAIKDIKKADYRQYDIQYYAASLKETDSEGNSKEISADKKKKLKAKMKKIAGKAEKGTDFTKLAEKDEEDIEFNKDADFVEKQGWSYLSDDNLKIVKKLKNGKISKLFYDEKAGYYVIVKMINNNSTEAYDSACEEAIQSAQNEKYSTWYTEEKEKHKVEVKTSVWGTAVLGSVTTDIVTLEDLEAMNEDSSDKASSSN